MKKELSEKRKKFLKENPDKHPWRNSQAFISQPCEHLKEKLKESGISICPEIQPLEDRFFSIDIPFPTIKIGLEVNGNQHYNRDGSLADYYQERKELIEKEGWKLYDIHYSKVYDDVFVSDLITKLKKNNSLEDIDYSFLIKEKADKRKCGNKEEATEYIRNENFINIHKPRIEKILNSNIDFSKFGWVKKVEELTGMKSQKVSKWMLKFMPNFYKQCYKRNKK